MRSFARRSAPSAVYRPAFPVSTKADRPARPLSAVPRVLALRLAELRGRNNMRLLGVHHDLAPGWITICKYVTPTETTLSVRFAESEAGGLLQALLTDTTPYITDERIIAQACALPSGRPLGETARELRDIGQWIDKRPLTRDEMTAQDRQNMQSRNNI